MIVLCVSDAMMLLMRVSAINNTFCIVDNDGDCSVSVYQRLQSVAKLKSIASVMLLRS